MIRTFAFICAALLVSSSALAEIIVPDGYGGTGSTCVPGKASWSTCERVSVPFAASVTNTVNVSGGYYASAYSATQSNTKYVLQGDITANNTAISVDANYVVVDLNGYTITYNNETAGVGVRTNVGYNRGYVAVTNGSIIQGADACEGDQYGRGCNPIGSGNMGVDGENNWRVMTGPAYVSNVYVEYSGRDVNGIDINSDYATLTGVEQVTVVDNFGYGTLKNRNQGIAAIKAAGGASYVKNCTIENARQVGVSGGADVSGNYITTLTKATNAAGIGTAGHIYNNTIIARGEHPVGLFLNNFDSSVYPNAHHNYINVKTTALGDEYSSAFLLDKNATILGNYAAGIRMKASGFNVRAHENYIVGDSDANYTGYYSPTGETAYIKAGVRGLMIGNIRGQNSLYENNIITVTDKDGSGDAFGVSVVFNHSDGLHISNNTISSDVCNIALGDAYSYCASYPLIIGNTLVKTGSWPVYKTYAMKLGSYWTAQARIVDSIYQGGASEASVDFYSNIRALKEAEDVLAANGTDVWFGETVGDSIYYSDQYHNANKTSATVIHATYDPAVILSQYAALGETAKLWVDAPDECSADNLGVCDQSGCAAVGGYWYNSMCNVNPEDPTDPTPTPPTTSGPLLRTGSSLLRVGDGVLRVQ